MDDKQTETAAGPADAGEPVVIGRGIRVTGSLRGKQDVVLEGHIEGTVSLHANRLTIDPGACMAGDVDARDVVVRGEHAGNTNATEVLKLDASARVLGDARTPRLVVADGAKFKGRVEMDVALPPDLQKLVAG